MNKNIKKLLSLRKKIAKLNEEAYSLNQLIIDSDLCDHSITSPYVWEHDNGYGIQTKCTAKRCDICFAVKYYTTWSHSY